ncbi:Hypothetical protein NTJ_12399 [Nesidiocoris tenuis]|uniref:G-protein coupled receptors family 2 profile 2 domain-containing protein n=1 Tax=Nesidiocoris tenuis TaxID=355587 RepID=A0ABN7B5A1_9HEMI|nr:Hypothetical protein NTJ_12399 [Nesidiocoris tenuis]
MKSLMLKSFICGSSIYTGALVIGWIHLFFTSITVFASTCFGIFMIPRLSSNETEHYLKDFIEQYLNQSRDPHVPVPDQQLIDQEVEAAILIVRSVWLILIVFAYINLASTISLLFGTYKRKRMCLIPWLILAAKNVLFSLISLIIWMLFVPIFLFGKHAHPYDTLSEIEIVCVYSFFLVFHSSVWIYAFLTVFTHYRELNYVHTHTSNNFQKL